MPEFEVFMLLDSSNEIDTDNVTIEAESMDATEAGDLRFVGGYSRQVIYLIARGQWISAKRLRPDDDD